MSRVQFVAALVVLSACTGQSAPKPPQASAALAGLLAKTYEQGLEQSIGAQMRAGRTIERLPSLSLATVEARAASAKALLDTLALIPRDALSESEQVSADVLQWLLEGELEAPQYYWLSLASVTPYQTPLLSELMFLGRDMPLGTDAERSRYVARLNDIGPLTDSIRTGLVAREERGVKVPKPEIKQIVGALGAVRQPGLKSPYAPPAARLATVDSAARPAFEAQVAKAVDEVINPAIGKLVDELNGAYFQNAPEGVGLSQYPNGEAYYRFLVKRMTTLDQRPEEIHQAGLAHMAKLEASMDSLLKVIGFRGTRQQFLEAMNKDPRFLAKTPEDVAARYQKYYEAIKPLVPKLFARSPKAPAEFRRLNPALEGSQTYGFYQPPSPASPVGIYFFNASNLSKRSLFAVAPIAYHELVPGHHFQFALAQENTDLPALRKEFYTTANGEGWAEYASELPQELGLYADPYDRYGRLISEAFLTARLVVDPGMNLLGWSREQAMQYLRDHTMMAESEIASETLRYSVDMPGQALGYKVGAFEFWRLRRKAEQELGDKFDIRAFHSVVLDPGGLPMGVVGRLVDRWIARVKAGL